MLARMSNVTERRAAHRAPHKIEAARRMRKALSKSELALWCALRGRQLGGLRFRRQQPIGPYIADFCCAAARLVIELDGEQHEEQLAYDEARTRFMEQAGYRVLRFPNREFFEDRARIREAIWRACVERIEERATG